MWGALPASVLWARHVDGLSMQRIDFRPAAGDGRPAFVADDVLKLVK